MPMNAKIYALLTAAIYEHALKDLCLNTLFFVLPFVRLTAFHLGNSFRLRMSKSDKSFSERMTSKEYLQKLMENNQFYY